jgi:SpoVK/Ycf46/Vps4 family AAA+-type ATPase
LEGIFRKAKASFLLLLFSPYVLVFDDLDSLARPKAGVQDIAGNERVLSQILTEIDHSFRNCMNYCNSVLPINLI